MNKKNQFAGNRIDEQVLFVMIGLIVVSSLVLAFRFKNVEPCRDVNVLVRAANFYQGSLISFRAETMGATTYNWDFNDGVQYESPLPSVQHSFVNPGTYIVSVVVNGHCEGFDTVIIKEAPVNRTVSGQLEFIAPDTASINKPVTLIDTTSDATSWEWRFGESDIIDASAQKVSYMYKTPGPKIIYLKINGRSDRVATRTIYVKDVASLIPDQNLGTKPIKRANNYGDIKIPIAPRDRGDKGVEGVIPPEPAKPKVYTDVQADEMIIFLQGVVTGEKKASDFTQYFCEGLDVPVTYNGTPMKFSQMCNMLRGFKKVNKIFRPEVQLIKSSSSNCIKMMTVNVKKRGKLNQIFH